MLAPPTPAGNLPPRRHDFTIAATASSGTQRWGSTLHTMLLALGTRALQLLPKSGHVLSNSPRLGRIRAAFGRNLVDGGRIWPKLDQVRPTSTKLGQFSQEAIEFGPISIDFGPAKSGPGSTKLKGFDSNLGLELSKFGRSWPGICQIWTENGEFDPADDHTNFRNKRLLARKRPNLANLGPALSKHGANSANFDQIWPGNDHVWPDFGQICQGRPTRGGVTALFPKRVLHRARYRSTQGVRKTATRSREESPTSLAGSDLRRARIWIDRSGPKFHFGGHIDQS